MDGRNIKYAVVECLVLDMVGIMKYKPLILYVNLYIKMQMEVKWLTFRTECGARETENDKREWSLFISGYTEQKWPLRK